MSTITLYYQNQSGKTIYCILNGTLTSIPNNETSESIGDFDIGCSGAQLPLVGQDRGSISTSCTLALTQPDPSNQITATVTNASGDQTGHWMPGNSSQKLSLKLVSGGLIVGVIDPGGSDDQTHS